MNKESRRKLLKGLALGVPAVWAKPIVDSVLLPAHAQTSSTCPSQFTIPGESLTCASPLQTATSIRYWIDDSSTSLCPMLMSCQTVDTSCVQPVGIANSFIISVRQFQGTINIAFADGGNNLVANAAVYCGPTIPAFFGVPGAINFNHTSINSNSYLVTATATETAPDIVALSDVVVTAV